MTTQTITARRHEAAVTFVKMEDNLRNMGGTIIQLMRHPDATEAMVVQAHIAYAEIWGSYQTTRTMLRARFPDTRTPYGQQLPWWKEGIK